MSQLSPAKAMPQMLAHLQVRRSVPAAGLGAPGPAADQVRQMATIAARVPDHGKITPWRFVIYPMAARQKFGQWFVAAAEHARGPLSREEIQKERARLTRAPVVVGVLSTPVNHPKVPQWEQVLSAGAACLNFLHAANALGFDAQWLTEWYALDRQMAARMGARPGERFAGFIHIGTALEPKTERARPDIDELLQTFEAQDG